MFIASKNKIGIFKLLFCSILLTLALNYKPLLTAFFIFYLIITKRFQIIATLTLLNGAIQLAIMRWNNNASYWSWFQLMLERNERINEGGNSNLVGTWAIISKMFGLTPKFMFWVSILMAVIIFYSVIFRKKAEFKFEDSLVFATIGVLLGPYSPAQDSILLSLILLRLIRNTKIGLFVKVYVVTISAFWSLSTEISPEKSSFLIIASTYVIYALFQSKKLAFFHLVLASFMLLITLISNDDHINYDLAGLGSLLSCVLLLLSMFGIIPVKNRFHKIYSRSN